ncbi:MULTISPECIES: hypothetical protein [unclassified Mycoplasma]|uniref:hypothetical protein n=1 Tax=unclassified Mycoplasma TaxID=2683645 RepID=UPI000FDDA709
MPTIYEVVKDLLTEHKTLSFQEIWSSLKKTMAAKWSKNPTDLKSDEFEKKKIGELYYMLTVDGDFVRQNENHWGLTKRLSYEEIKKTRIRVPENNE